MKTFEYTIKDGVGSGDTVTITVEGPDEDRAAADMEKFLSETV